MGSQIEAPIDQPKKKGFLGRFRRGRKKTVEKEPLDDTVINEEVEKNSEDSESEPRSPPKELDEDLARKIDVDDMRAVRFPEKDALKGKTQVRKERELRTPPSAKEAAFGGPPRYDWIDIETAAAIKLQSVYRRNKTMSELEEQGITTAAIRNRARRREARKESKGFAGGADIPNIFACCGVGLAFGDATEQNYEAYRQHEREQYLQRRKEQEAREEELRKNFKKSVAKKKAAARDDVEECVEIVE